MKNLLSLTSFLILALFLSGCGKTEGCTDPASTNFDPTAHVDNGTCNYEGSVMFWNKQHTAQMLYLDGVENLAYYINGELIATENINNFWNKSEVPACGEERTVTKKINLGSSKNKEFTYEIKDAQTNFPYKNGKIDITSGNCLSIEYVYGN